MPNKQYVGIGRTLVEATKDLTDKATGEREGDYVIRITVPKRDVATLHTSDLEKTLERVLGPTTLTLDDLNSGRYEVSIEAQYTVPQEKKRPAGAAYKAQSPRDLTKGLF